MIEIPREEGKYKDMQDEKTYRFPKELLDCDNKTRKEYFMNYIATHEFLEKSIEKTITILNSPISERLIFVCGPSGVGKDEYIRELTTRISNDSTSEEKQNRSYIPVVNVDAQPSGQGGFNFNNLWKETLINLKEPLIDSKISYEEETHINSDGQAVSFSKIKAADFHSVLMNTLNFRNVKAMIINEAHHLLQVASGKKANDSVNLLKSLTNGSHARIILVGTYSLCTFLEDLDYTKTDQINQRTRIVDFPRYHKAIPEEMSEFGKTAKKLLIHMPLETTAENLIDSDWEYFYKYSLGCIGTLKIWLTDAYSLALDSKSNTITKEHLEETRKPGSRLSIMYDSILDGEKKKEYILSEGDLDAKLKSEIMNSKTQENLDAKLKAEVMNNKAQENPRESPVRPNSKPFERNPKRDKVLL